METETIEEYLARGGTIKQCQPCTYEIQESVYVQPNNTLLSMSHGQDLYTKKNSYKRQSRGLDVTTTGSGNDS